MANEYYKELQEKIANLQDGFDIKNIEVAFLESEMQDVLEPSLLLSQITYIHTEMLSELFDYIRKNKPSERLTASKERLLNLLTKTEKLNSMTNKMQTLKLFNRELVVKLQLLGVENDELRKQLKNISDANNF